MRAARSGTYNEVRIENIGARRTPDNVGYSGYNEALNAYYEVISYAKLLDDAKKRNRVLFDSLQLPTVGEPLRLLVYANYLWQLVR